MKPVRKMLGLTTPKIPDPPEVKVAPDPDAKEAARAESRKRQRASNSGRVSTILSEGSKLG